MENMILTFVGNDDGFGNKNNSAYIVENNELFILDCGFTVFNEIKNKFNFSKYKKLDNTQLNNSLFWAYKL